MKSMKKILSVILAVALLSAFIVVPVSAISMDAEICEDLNVLRGDGSGVTEEYLSKLTNRSQGAKILLRLMGLEDEADSYTGTATFSDASDATGYWQPMLAYLKANPDAGFRGYPDGTFAPNKVMTAQEIYKVILVSLGFVENVDFTWEEVFTFAAGKGLTALNGVGQITNDDLATALVEALQATKADGQQLVSFLIDEGVVSLIAAQNAGLVPTVLTVMDAFASGSKEITATLNMAAPTGTTAVLKKGTVVWPGVTVTWDSNRKSVKFSRTLNFTAGAYTVQIGDSTFDLTIQEETLTGISIGADYIFPMADQDLKVSLYNQYGEPMTILNTQIFVFANDGTTLTYTNTGTTIKVDASVAGLDDATMVTINVLHTTTGLNAIKTIPLYEAPEIKALNFAGLTIANSASRLEENTSGHILRIEATDQYGNPYKLTDADIASGGQISILNSNPTSVATASFDINADGNLVFNALDAGTSTITFLIPMQAIVRNYTITVNPPVHLDSLVISAGTEMAYVGDWFDLTTYAYDELGQPIAMSGNFDFSKFYVISNNPTAISSAAFSYNDSTGKLSVLPTGVASSVTVSYYYNMELLGSFPITVYEAPEPSFIQSVTFPTYFEEGATREMTLDDVVVYSQHLKPFDLTGTDYYIQIERTSGTTMTADATLSGTSDATFTATTTEGTTTFKLKIMHNTQGAVVGSDYPISVQVVGTEDVTTFAFNPVSTMYAGGVSQTAYYKTLSLSGRIGTKEVVLAGTGAVPASISLITNSNSAEFTLDEGTLVLYSSAAGSTIIKAWIGGNVVAQTTVTSSSTAPVVNTIVFTENPKTIDLSGGTYDLKTSNLQIKDQYGVNITASSNVSYFSSNPAVVTVNASGVVTPVGVGTTTISVVENSGAGSAILTITVE